MRTIGLRRLGGLAPGFEGKMTRLLVLLVFDLPLGLRRRRWPRFFWPFFPVAAFEEHNSSNHLKLQVPYIYHIYHIIYIYIENKYLLHGPCNILQHDSNSYLTSVKFPDGTTFLHPYLAFLCICLYNSMKKTRHHKNFCWNTTLGHLLGAAEIAACKPKMDQHGTPKPMITV